MLIIAGGPPKSGTKYISEVLTACGIYTRHEQSMRGPTKDLLYPSDALAESSYASIPWFPRFKGIKILIARAPLNTIRSHYGALGMIHQPDKFFYPLFPEIFEEEGIKRFAWLWVKWMSWGLEYADLVWSVPVSPDNIDKLNSTLSTLKNVTLPLLDPDIATRIEPSNSNKHIWENVDIPWKEITSDRLLMDQIESIADKVNVSLFEEL